MKPVIVSTDKAISEMENQHPSFVTMEDQISQAVSQEDVITMKQLIFETLKKFELFIEKEIPKLKNKPRKTTKFVTSTRRPISMLKSALDFLPHADQTEAYPTLAVIIKHYLKILPSSLRKKDSPRVTASNMYNFIKDLFNLDVEYVLDVILCSNVPENGSKTIAPVEFCFLSEALIDQPLYIGKLSTFAKHLSIAAQINNITDGRDPKLKNAILELEQKSNDKNTYQPGDIQKYLDQVYGIGNFGENCTFMDVISKLETLNIASITRQEPLAVVSSTSQSASENKENEYVSSLPSVEASNTKPNPDSLFYFDANELNTEPGNNETASALPTIGIEERDDEKRNETANVASATYQLIEGEHNNQPESDEELEVVFVGVPLPPKPKRTVVDATVNEDEDDSDFDERDEADPESDEEMVPHYTSDDYGHGRAGRDTDGTDTEDGDEDNWEMEVVFTETENDLTGIAMEVEVEGMDLQIQETCSNVLHSSLVEIEAREKDNENPQDVTWGA